MDELDELKLQHKNLEDILSSLQKKFDENNIVRTDLKNQFTLLKENENKYVQEIDHLQNNEDDETKKLRDKLKLLQSELKCYEESFQLELFEGTEELLNLHDELDCLPNQDDNDVEESNEEVLEEIFKTNLDLEIQLDKLNDDMDETKLKLIDFQKENEELSIYIQNVNADLEHASQNLKFKNEEVHHAYKLLREIEEECRITNNELKGLSEKPQNLVDEGSIFSEVNNRRLNLKESNNKLKTVSNNIINEKVIAKRKLSKIRSNHHELESLLNSELKDIQYDNKCSYIYYRSRNNVLEEMVHFYNQIISEKMKLITEGLPSDGFRYLHKYIDFIEAAMKKWKESQNKRRLSVIMLTTDLTNANLKLTVAQNLSLQLQSKVKELEDNIENFKLAQKENIEPTSMNVTKYVSARSLALDKKEPKTDKIEKKVAFAADTVEPKPSGRQVRRGKVLKYKTMYID